MWGGAKKVFAGLRRVNFWCCPRVCQTLGWGVSRMTWIERNQNALQQTHVEEAQMAKFSPVGHHVFKLGGDFVSLFCFVCLSICLLVCFFTRNRFCSHFAAANGCHFCSALRKPGVFSLEVPSDCSTSYPSRTFRWVWQKPVPRKPTTKSWWKKPPKPRKKHKKNKEKQQNDLRPQGYFLQKKEVTSL